MSGKKLLLVGMAVVVVLGTVFMVGCGSKDDGKAALQTALDKVEIQIGGLMGSITQATGATLKEAMAGSDADWKALVKACEGYKGADAVKAQKVWDDMFAAVNALPNTAGVAEIIPAVTVPGTALNDFVVSLRKLVGPSATATTVAAGEPATTVAPAADATTTTVAAQ